MVFYFKFFHMLEISLFSNTLAYLLKYQRKIDISFIDISSIDVCKFICSTQDFNPYLFWLTGKSFKNMSAKI